MVIVWDEPKRRLNLEKHGIDFADLDERFFAGGDDRPGQARTVLRGRVARTDDRGDLCDAWQRGDLDRLGAPGEPQGKDADPMTKYVAPYAPGFVPRPGVTQENWNEVCDNPELTTEDIASMRPFAEVFPHLAATIKRRGPQKTPTKVSTTIRLSPEVLAHFRAGGPGWQSRIDAVLRKWVRAADAGGEPAKEPGDPPQSVVAASFRT